MKFPTPKILAISILMMFFTTSSLRGNDEIVSHADEMQTLLNHVAAKDVILIAWLDQPEKLIESMMGCDLVESFDMLKKSFTNEAAGFSFEDLLKLQSTALELKTEVEKMEYLLVVVWQDEADRTSFTVFCKSTQEVADSAFLLMNAYFEMRKTDNYFALGSSYNQRFSDPFRSMDTAPEDKAIQPSAEPGEITQRFTRSTLAGLHAFHSSSIASQKCSDRLDRVQDSVWNSRSFQRIWKSYESNRPDLFAYGVPVKCVKLLPGLIFDGQVHSADERVASSIGLNEIPAAGFGIKFNDNAEQKHLLTGKVVLAFTMPRTGISREWECRRPVDEIPSLSLPVFEVALNHIDKARSVEELNQIRNRLAKKERNQVDESSGLYNKEDVVPAFSTRIVVRYLPEFDNVPFAARRQRKSELLVIDRVQNFDVARIYVSKISESLIKKLGKENAPEVLVSESSEFLAAESIELARRKMGEAISNDIKKFDDTILEERTPEENLRREARFLNENWHLLGLLDGIETFRGERGSESPNCLEHIQSRVETLQEDTKESRKPFAIEAFSPISWRLWTSLSFTDSMTKRDNFKPENRQESIAMIQAAITASVLNRFGTQLRAYTQDDASMTISFRIFEEPSDIFNLGSEFESSKLRIDPFAELQLDSR